MEIKRDKYLEKIISYMWDGQVKVITGIRRSGKSYLLGTLFRKYLLENGTKPENIFSYAFDLASDIRYRNPLELVRAVRERVRTDGEQYYLLWTKYRCLTKCLILIIRTVKDYVL